MTSDRNFVVRMNKVHSAMLVRISKQRGFSKSEMVRFLIVNEAKALERKQARARILSK